MALFKHYLLAAIYPSLAAIILALTFSIVDSYGYKSEWLTAESIILFMTILAIIYSLIISLLTLTIFLNKYEQIRKNYMLNGLTWFLLPLSFIGVTLFMDIDHRLQHNDVLNSDFIYTLILNVPFIIGLISSFWRYRKEQKLYP